MMKALTAALLIVFPLHSLAVPIGIKAGDTVYGTNASFTVLSSAPLVFRSPLLVWSEDNSYMKFDSILTGQNAKFVADVKILCQKTLDSKDFSSKWSVDVNVAESENHQCFQIINFAQDPNRCVSFRVRLRITVTGDNLTISNFQFGGMNLCSQSKVASETFNCNLDNGDCGIRNDACGLDAWELRPQSSIDKKSSICESSTAGIPLIKKQLHSKCFYDLDVTSLQPSGFTLINDVVPPSSLTATRRKRQSSGYSLVLDPSSGLVTGILDLPVLTHASANSYLAFSYEMLEDGAHDLMVTAVCTSDPTNYLVPLKPLSLHYHKQNFYVGSSGTICLDIHEFVHQEDCSTFAIQLQGAAVDTYLVVDDLVFHENVPSGMVVDNM